jgi:hypothetical protein
MKGVQMQNVGKLVHLSGGAQQGACLCNVDQHHSCLLSHCHCFHFFEVQEH